MIDTYCPVLLFTARDGLCGKVKLAPPPTYLPPSHHGKPSAPARARSEARRARAARRGGAEAGALHPARGRHRLAPQLTALRPLRRRAAGVAQKATPGVGCSLDPSPAAPSPGRLTAHGALGCSPPPPRVPRRHACPCLDALCASRARVSGTDGAATAPAVAAPPPRRARCRRRRRRRLLAVSPSPRAATHAPCPDGRALRRALQRQSARLSQTEQRPRQRSLLRPSVARAARALPPPPPPPPPPRRLSLRVVCGARVRARTAHGSVPTPTLRHARTARCAPPPHPAPLPSTPFLE